MSRNFSAIRYIDKWSVLLYLVLVLFGWLNIYGASVGENQSSIFDMSVRSIRTSEMPAACRAWNALPSCAALLTFN